MSLNEAKKLSSVKAIGKQNWLNALSKDFS